MRKSSVFLGALAAFFIAFRIYLPTLVKNYVNRVLDHVSVYHGHVERVGIHLWRSAYSSYGITLVKTDGEVPVPFFSASAIDFSIHWGALFHGQLVAKMDIFQPKLNFVENDSAGKKQISIDESWQTQVKKLFPLRISRMRIQDGEIHFRNYQAQPPIDLYLHEVNALAANLTNSRKLSKTLKATLDVAGLAMTSGRFKAHVAIDPLIEKPTFKCSLQVEDLDLRELNDFFKYYLAVIAKNGTFSFYMEGVADEGAFKGYAKPLVNHLDLIKVKTNPSLAEALKAMLVKFVGYVMKNHAKDRLAARIDLSGTVKNPKAGTWSAIASFFGNWLVHAISPGLEKELLLEDAHS